MKKIFIEKMPKLLMKTRGLSMILNLVFLSPSEYFRFLIDPY